MGATSVKFHDNLQDDALWSTIAVRSAESIVADKHVNDVRVIGAGYSLIVFVCTNKYKSLIVKRTYSICILTVTSIAWDFDHQFVCAFSV